MAKKNKRTQIERDFFEFKKDYLKFLEKIAQVRERQLLLMKEISQKADAYKIAQFREDRSE